MRPVKDIVLIGPMGSGKSTVAQALAQHSGTPLVDLDQHIEATAGMRIADIFAREGEAGFRAREHAALKEALAQGRVVATGGGVVLAPENRALLRDTVCVWLDAPIETLAARLREEAAHRPLLQGTDVAEKLAALDAVRRPLYAEVAQLHIDTHGASLDEIAARISAALAVLQ